MARTQAGHLIRGRNAEEKARRHLERHGLRLLERNYRSPFGEIDLIMRAGETIVFVEVRYRRSNEFGAPEETVDRGKQRKLRATAEYYLLRNRAATPPCRFDIVAVSGTQDTYINWLQNAF